MSLAARALGVADVVRPRRSLFEPRRSAPELVSPREPVAEASFAEPEAPADIAPPATTPMESPEQPAVAEPARRRRPQTVAPPRPRVPAMVDRLPETERERSRSDEPVPVAAGGEPSLRRPQARPARSVPLAPARMPEYPLEPPRAPAARPPRILLRPEAAAPATVRVTIGRVDVRAIVPEKPAGRKPRQAPRMSLDEYLSRDGRA